MLLTKTEYTISRDRLKEELKALWAQENRVAAIRLVCAVADMGLKEAKEYCEGGFVDIIPNGTEVKVSWRVGMLYVHASWVNSSGVVWYWLKEDDEISTYSEADVILFPEDRGENQ